MAINPEAQYAGKISPSSADYPYGRARNITIPGDGTGTPLESAWLNDVFGFQQALLTEAEIVPSGSPETATDSQYLAAMRVLFPTFLTEDLAVSIPTDYPDLTSAFEGTARFRPAPGVKITVTIETGHRLTSPLILRGGDYSHYRIESVDALVEVENDSLSTTGFRQDIRPVFGALSGCNFPVVAIKLDLRPYLDGFGNPSGSGFLCVQGSTMLIEPTGGCLGGQQGVIAYDGSVVNCEGADFKYSRNAGITAWSNSQIFAQGADASFSELYGVRSTEGASLIFKLGKATDCARHASRAVASAFLDVTSADLRRSATKGVYARHSCVVMANFADCRDCVEDGFYAQRGSIITCIESFADGSGTGYRAEDGSTLSGSVSSAQNCGTSLSCVNSSTAHMDILNCAGSTNVAVINANSTASLRGVTCAGPAKGILVADGSSVNCPFASITDSLDSALRVFFGSKANADDSTFTGATGNAVFAQSGSVISAQRADCSNSDRGFVAVSAEIFASQSVANGCTDGIYLVEGSRGAFSSATATGCVRGIRADSSRADCQLADFSAASGSGCFAEKGSDVSLRGANCRKGASDDPTDITCVGGSMIKTSQTVGGTSIPVNSPQASGLILG